MYVCMICRYIFIHMYIHVHLMVKIEGLLTDDILTYSCISRKLTVSKSCFVRNSRIRSLINSGDQLLSFPSLDSDKNYKQLYPLI
jgi:hypothetical protein